MLAMYTPNYGPAPTADVSKTELVNDDRHNSIFAQHGHSPATLRVFLEPVAAASTISLPRTHTPCALAWTRPGKGHQRQYGDRYAVMGYSRDKLLPL
jgi:hypothetical protein